MRAKLLFKNYIKGLITKQQLVTELYKLQAIHKNIWFRLFKGDTGAYTVGELENLLSQPPNCYQSNQAYINECIQLGVSSNSIQVNY